MQTRIDTGNGPSVDFTSPKGAPAYLAPDSQHWRIYKNPIALGVGGICAVLLEFADPRIRSGVWDHSTYRIDPIGRSQRTGVAAMVGCYGPRESAEKMIAGITRMHGKVVGETPGGRAYQALDPELLNWVHATARFGFMKAYHRYVAPLSEAEERNYWNEGKDLAALWGVTESPTSEYEFLNIMNALAPGFEAHSINSEFLGIVESSKAAGKTPLFIRRAITRAAVDLLPTLVREKLELGSDYDLSWFDRVLLRLLGRIAERRFDPASAPAIASERLGLPARFLWLSAAKQAQLLDENSTAIGAELTS